MSEKFDKFLVDMDKTFGEGSFRRVGDKPRTNIETTGSGSLILDSCLGGGYPVGRVIEAYGGESAGKTTLMLQAISNIQQIGKVAFIDVEHALDLEYASLLGVDVDNLFITQPDSGDDALEMLDKILDSGEFRAVVVDSVAALTPKAELEGEMGQSNIGLQARLMSQALRKIVAKTQKSKCTVFFINQLRSRIGVMYGNPLVTAGGNALKYYASQRLEINRSTQIKDSSGGILGHVMRIKVVKNKIAPPHKIAEVKLLYGVGISKEDEIIEQCVELGIIKKGGSWYSYGKNKLGQGQNTVRQLLKDNPELAEELLDKLTKNKLK